jgi:hypothetical protein
MRPHAPPLGPISFSVKGSPATHCVNPLFSPGSIETTSIVFCLWVAT